MTSLQDSLFRGLRVRTHALWCVAQWPVRFVSFDKTKKGSLVRVCLSDVSQDRSVQKLIGPLATGGFPKLKTLRLGNNKLTDVSTTMLNGLKMLRKDLTIVTESLTE
eukprot:590106-Prorocentrum_minimum.AAC.1